MKHHDETTRQHVERLALQGDLSLGQISRETGVPKSTVSRWARAARAKAEPTKAPAEPEPDTPPEPSPEPSPEPAPQEAAADRQAPPPSGLPDFLDLGGFEPMRPGGDPDPFGTPEPGIGPAHGLDEPALQQEGETVSPDMAAAMLAPVVGIVDARLTSHGADPITEPEREALCQAWAPIVAKWLSGPEAPLMAAVVTTGAVLGPRVMQARKGRQAAEAEAQDPPKPKEQQATDKPGGIDAVHAALRGSG